MTQFNVFKPLVSLYSTLLILLDLNEQIFTSFESRNYYVTYILNCITQSVTKWKK